MNNDDLEYYEFIASVFFMLLLLLIIELMRG